MGAELGKYKSCVSARSTNKEILKHAQDGGIVTSLFGFALDEGIIDGAIVAATKEFAAQAPGKSHERQLQHGISSSHGDQSRPSSTQRKN